MAEVNFKLNLVPEMDIQKINVLLSNLKQSLGKLGDDIQLIDEAKIVKEFENIAKAQSHIAEQSQKQLDNAEANTQAAKELLGQKEKESQVYDAIYSKQQSGTKAAKDDAQAQRERLAALENQRKKLIEINRLELDKSGNIIKIDVETDPKDLNKIEKLDTAIANWQAKKDNLVKKLNIQMDAKGNLIESGLSENIIKQLKNIDAQIAAKKDGKLKIDAKLEVKKEKIISDYNKLRNDIQDEMKPLQVETEAKASPSSSLAMKAFNFNQIAKSTQFISDNLNQFADYYIQYEKQLADFSAITGVSGEALDSFGDKARNLAKEFGGSATGQIEAFKGVLSKLGPQIAESPAALEAMGRAINTLSVASGMDATTSMEALTTGLLQFNVSLDNPIEAAKEMTKQMHVMAAGAKFGAAEIPQVKDAITVAGVAASGAKLSFEETNAAIQVLAAGGKYGAEAGTALRNVLGMLQKASGPAELAMHKLGTSSKELGEVLTTQGVGVAMAKLQAGMNGLGSDAEKNATLMEIFGTENASAAGIMMKNADAIGELTSQLTGTSTAYEQAEVNMNTMSAKIERFKANLEDMFIGTFQTLGKSATTAVGAVKELMPLITTGLALKEILPEKAIEQLKNFPSLIKGIPNSMNAALPGVNKFSQSVENSYKSLPSAIKNIVKTAPKELRTMFSNINIKPLTNALASGGKNAATFAAMMAKTVIPPLASIGPIGSASFATVGAAGTSSGAATATAWAAAAAPILGIVAAGALVVATFIGLYKNVEAFRNIVDGTVEIVSYGFERIGEVVGALFNILYSVGEAVFTFMTMPFQIAWGVIKALISPILDLTGATGDAASVIEALGGAFDAVLNVINFVLAGIKGFKAAMDSVIGTMSGVIAKILKGDIVGAVMELSAGGTKAGQAFTNSLTNSINDGTIQQTAKNLNANLEKAAKIKAKLEVSTNLDNMTAEYRKVQSEIQSLEIKPKGDWTAEDKKRFEDLSKKAQETADNIAKIVPEAKSNMGTIVDANGNIKETYDINIAKVKEFNSAQKEGANQDLTAAQQKQTNGILDMSAAYQNQVKVLEIIKKEMDAAYKAGDTDEVKKKTKEFEEQKKKISENKELLTKSYQEASKQKLILPDAEVKVANVLGMKLTLDDVNVRNQVDELKSKIKDSLSLQADIKTTNDFEQLIQDYESAQNKINELRSKKKTGNITDDEMKALDDLEKKQQTTANKLAQVAPSAKQGIKIVQDANGVLTESFDINLSKVKDLAAEQKNSFSGDTKKAMEEYSSGLNSITSIYDTNKSQLSKIKQEIDAAAAAGRTDEVVKKKDEYNKLLTTINKYKADLVSAYIEGKDAGLLTKDAQEQLLKKMGMTEEQARKFAAEQKNAQKNQKDITAAVDETGKELETIGQKFNKAMQDAKTAQTEALSEYAAAVKERKQAEQSGDKEAIARAKEKELATLKEQKVKAAAAAKEIQLGEESTAIAKKALGLEEKKAKSSKSSVDAKATELEKAKKLYEQYEKNIKQEEEESQVMSDTVRISQNREKNSIDELLTMKKKVDTQKALSKAMIETFNLKLDDKGKIIEVGISVNEVDQKKMNDLQAKVDKYTTQKNEIITKYKLQIDPDTGDVIESGIPKTVLASLKNVNSNIKRNQDAKIKLEAKLNDSKEDIISKWNVLANETNKSKNSMTEIQAKVAIDDDSLKKAKRDIEIEGLRLKIELGVEPPESILPYFENDIQKAKDAYSKIESELVEARKQAVLPGLSSPELDAYIASLEKNAIEAKQKILSAEKSLNSERKAIYEQNSKDLEEKYAKDTEETKKSYELQSKLLSTFNATYEATSTNLLDREKSKRLAKLEQQKEAEILTEEQYNQAKEKLEEDHQKKIETMKDIARGAEMEAERQQALKLLQLEKEKVKAQMKNLDPGKDSEKYKQLSKQLDELEVDISDKGNILLSVSGDIQTGLTDIMANLWAGEEEDVKKPFRKLFMTLGGALKNYLSMLVTQMVFGELSKYPKAGLYSLVLIPMFRGVMQGALNKILDPVLSSIASFSTGGYVSSPTLAVVGDASDARPGSDGEWILRDDQLWTIFEEVLNQHSNVLKVQLKDMASELISQISYELKSNFKKYVNQDDLISLIQQEFTPAKAFELDMKVLQARILAVGETVDKMIPLFKKSDVSSDELYTLIEQFDQMRQNEQALYNGLIDENGYNSALSKNISSIQTLAPIQVNNEVVYVKEYARGAAAMNNQTITDASTAFDTSRLEAKLDKVIQAVESLTFRAVMLDKREIAEEVNRYNRSISRR